MRYGCNDGSILYIDGHFPKLKKGDTVHSKHVKFYGHFYDGAKPSCAELVVDKDHDNKLYCVLKGMDKDAFHSGYWTVKLWFSIESKETKYKIGGSEPKVLGVKGCRYVSEESVEHCYPGVRGSRAVKRG